MNRSLTVLFLFVLLSSCVNKSQKQNDKYILGDWVYVRPHYKHNSKLVPPPPEIPITGFSFYANHTYDNKIGFYRYNKPNDDPLVYFGTISKFRITSDRLALFNLADKKWTDFKIVKLTSDSLQIKDNDALSTYVHQHLTKTHTPQFDKIILSTSGCFGSCPVSNTIICSDGTIVFEGKNYTTKKGLFSAKISQKNYQQLQDNFRKVDFDSLKNSYQAHWTDDETITSTFVKGGKIYKTVSDYGKKAPLLFVWAYTPLRNFYQRVALKDISNTGYVSKISSISDSYLKKGDKKMYFKSSETFLLLDCIRTGKISTQTFSPRFKLHANQDIVTSLYEIDTDGRFYTFIVKGKPVTIDIGFNFYDVNAKNWPWQKSDKYD